MCLSTSWVVEFLIRLIVLHLKKDIQKYLKPFTPTDELGVFLILIRLLSIDHPFLTLKKTFIFQIPLEFVRIIAVFY